jgi:hypothetical protein
MLLFFSPHGMLCTLIFASNVNMNLCFNRYQT